jgi:8-oxo-dGTP pyrophosphatase MutT (NUDIX family)
MPEITQLSTTVVYQTPWMRVREDEIAYPDGSTGVYSVLEKPDFALVIPYENGGFWLVEQFRYAVGQRCWEFPQGTWPPDHSADQDAEARHGAGDGRGSMAELAVAELAEETGLTASVMVDLGRLFAAYGYCPQSFHVFLATGLTAGEPHREASEQDMVHQWFLEAEVRKMIKSGELADAHSVAALALFDAR